MIQRIQTVYIVLAVVFTIACLCLQIGTFDNDGLVVGREYNLWLIDGMCTYSLVTWPMFAVLVLSAALGIYTIFVYSNRRNQARLCVFNLLLLVGWYILYGVYSRVLAGGALEQADFVPSMPAAFPGLAFVFYILARRGIMADERLVRAADRIR